MPQAKSKPSEIAAEAKKLYIPHCVHTYPQFPARSTLYPESSKLRVAPKSGPARKLRVAIIDGDPVDVALSWHESNCKDTAAGSTSESSVAGGLIPVVIMANEKRAGGDWESGLIAPEECLCRRSTLSQALITPSSSSKAPHYPIKTSGGIYSPSVVVFRAGADKGYAVWKEFKALPVISVAPVRRPKLDESGANYSFSQEKELMKEKMRVVLRIAAARQHVDICMGAFGVGFGFRNPAGQVARMWRELLFGEKEFQGVFSNVVFAIESATSGSSKDGMTELDVFKKEFAPSNVIKTAYR